MTRINGRRLGLPASAIALASGVLALGACNLDVSTPDVVPPDATAGKSALPTLLAGAAGDFSVAYGGYSGGDVSDGIIQNSGLFTDELIATDYFTTHAELDTRLVTPPNDANLRVMRHLMQSVASAEATAARYAQFSPTDPGFARALNYVGYDYVLVAENFCSGVPFSTMNPDGSYNWGTPQTTQQMLTAAIQRFDSAKAIVSSATSAAGKLQYYTALVGKARAQLDLGQAAAAAATVAPVPTSFSFTTEHSTSNAREKNGVFELTWVNTRMTEADNEGINGLPFVSSNDPRTSAEYAGKSTFDAGTALYPPDKYSSYTAPEVIASGIEARLIEAEAALQAGNYATPGGTLDILNSLRQSIGLSLLPAADSAQAQQNQLFTERAFWMYGTAHRLGDLRRLMKAPYNRAEDSIFPTGDYFKGQSYGNQVSMPVPQTEENNPQFKRSACDPTKP